MRHVSLPFPTLLFRVYLPFAAGYFLSYAFRVVNAVIAGDLRADLGIDGSVLGLLTSTYFLAFAAFQLPLGYLLDRFGSRRVESSMLLVAAAGAFVFSMSGTVAGLIAGRALIGLGVSACLMAAFKAYVDWFPADRLPRINGLQMAAGGLGALTATRPMEMSLPLLGWEGVFRLMGIACVVVAAVIFLAVPDGHRDAHRGGRANVSGFTTVFTTVFASRLFLRVVPFAVTAQASFMSLASLWAGVWLRDVAGLERSQAANVLAAMTIAMILGWVVLGSIASALGRRGVSTFTTAIACVATAAVPLLVMAVMQGDAPAGACWTAFGFFGTGTILFYAAMSQSFPKEIAGRVNTALNLLVFTGAFVLQWSIGIVVDHYSAGDAVSIVGYRVALFTLVTLQALSLAWYLLFRPRETGAGPAR